MIRAISTQLEHDSGTYLSLMLDERVFCEAPLIINYKTALLCVYRLEKVFDSASRRPLEYHMKTCMSERVRYTNLPGTYERCII
jgi:hypothetical protein